MKVLVIHPGHTFSTSDVFDGLVAGLEANGVAVVQFRWDSLLQTFSALGAAAMVQGLTDDSRSVVAMLGRMATADTLTIALQEEVDAVIVVNGLLYPSARALVMQKLGVPVVCYGTEAPYMQDREIAIARHYTHFFTQERNAVATFKAAGINAHYLPMAWNPKTHQPGPKDADKHVDAVFVGGGYPERKALLDGVTIPVHRFGTLWHIDIEQERANGTDDHGKYAEGSITNAETAAWHRSALVSLNMHRKMTYIATDAPIATGAAASLGPRAYEIPAVGGFMLSDDERPEIYDVLGDSACTFKAWDSADLSRQLRYWLTHPDRRESAARAQFEAIQPHTWTARAATVLETISA